MSTTPLQCALLSLGYHGYRVKEDTGYSYLLRPSHLENFKQLIDFLVQNNAKVNGLHGYPLTLPAGHSINPLPPTSQMPQTAQWGSSQLSYPGPQLACRDPRFPLPSQNIMELPRLPTAFPASSAFPAGRPLSPLTSFSNLPRLPLPDDITNHMQSLSLENQSNPQFPLPSQNTMPRLPTAFPALAAFPAVPPQYMTSVPSSNLLNMLQYPMPMPSPFPSGGLPSNLIGGPFTQLTSPVLPSQLPSTFHGQLPSTFPSQLPSTFPGQLPSTFPGQLPGSPLPGSKQFLSPNKAFTAKPTGPAPLQPDDLASFGPQPGMNLMMGIDPQVPFGPQPGTSSLMSKNSTQESKKFLRIFQQFFNNF